MCFDPLEDPADVAARNVLAGAASGAAFRVELRARRFRREGVVVPRWMRRERAQRVHATVDRQERHGARVSAVQGDVGVAG